MVGIKTGIAIRDSRSPVFTNPPATNHSSPIPLARNLHGRRDHWAWRRHRDRGYRHNGRGRDRRRRRRRALHLHAGQLTRKWERRRIRDILRRMLQVMSRRQRHSRSPRLAADRAAQQESAETKPPQAPPTAHRLHDFHPHARWSRSLAPLALSWRSKRWNGQAVPWPGHSTGATHRLFNSPSPSIGKFAWENLLDLPVVSGRMDLRRQRTSDVPATGVPHLRIVRSGIWRWIGEHSSPDKS